MSSIILIKVTSAYLIDFYTIPEGSSNACSFLEFEILGSEFNKHNLIPMNGTKFDSAATCSQQKLHEVVRSFIYFASLYMY